MKITKLSNGHYFATEKMSNGEKIVQIWPDRMLAIRGVITKLMIQKL